MAAQPNYRRIARNKARKYGLDPKTFQRQIKFESGFDVNAGSSAGAQGIAQIMPATAASWGVDPYKPKQALDAAAKHMAEYVKQYGSYKDALVAYNAGPGRVGMPLYAETAAYIQRILGDKPGQTELYDAKSSTGNNPKPTQGRVKVRAATKGKTVTKPDEAARRAALLQYVATPKEAGSDRLLTLAMGLRDAVTTTATPGKPAKYKNAPEPKRNGGKPRDGKSAPASGDPSAVAEMFWQGPGGINIDEGKVVPQGYVEGHTGHVHFASRDRKTLLRVAKRAQEMGLRVGENDKWDPVDPVHSDNSFHYQNFPGRKLDMAIDVSGDVGRMKAFAHWVARQHGLK